MKKTHLILAAVFAAFAVTAAQAGDFTSIADADNYDAELARAADTGRPFILAVDPLLDADLYDAEMARAADAGPNHIADYDDILDADIYDAEFARLGGCGYPSTEVARAGR